MVKNPPVNSGDPLHYSFLGNHMYRRAWQATYSPWEHKESDMSEYPFILYNTETSSVVRL